MNILSHFLNVSAEVFLNAPTYYDDLYYFSYLKYSKDLTKLIYINGPRLRASKFLFARLK